MKVSFPHMYSATIDRVAVSRARIEAGQRPVLQGGPPPEFQGDEVSWTPEHLLMAALGLCLFTTFEAFAARDKLTVVSWRDTAKGELDRTASGLAFKSFVIEIDVTVAAGEAGKAQEVFDKAKKNCIISRALTPAPEVVLRIASAPE
ncbi:MAG: OsmC family protein [Myxococcales bacterium]|nr:OsmC family protein [Myxococcales bacterium]HRC54935.1 OsmC family protein [Kofleriaceae bacterium]